MTAIQTLRLPTHFSNHSYTPTSPDPTPLRLLAFSVAESALECDPNSPLFMSGSGVEGDWVGEWCSGLEGKKSEMGKSRGKLWGIVERAKERRERDQFTAGRPSSPLASPPISPSSYAFSIPSDTHFVPTRPSRPVPTTLTLHPRQTRPLQTRSAEPSPVKCTFSTLDQSRPPPEFVPRLTASEFAQVENKCSPVVLLDQPPKSPSAVLRKQAVTQAKGRQPKAGLPSLAQIHAKMSKTRTHKRGASLGAIPHPRASSSLSRSDTQDTMEVLVTPTEEDPHRVRQPRVVLQSIINRGRPPTPPSPTGLTKESTLAPFLRQRTSGRLATATRSIPTPPRIQTSSPVLKITPPTLDSTLPAQPSTPTRVTIPGYPFPHLSTPPQSRYAAPTSTSPTSPTFSQVSMASPTLSVPIITCTPAPQRVKRNGVEEDSDEEEGSVVVFSAEEEDSDGECEREKRGREMKALLKLRRKSDA